jgi:hypothetical protein
MALLQNMPDSVAECMGSFAGNVRLFRRILRAFKRNKWALLQVILGSFVKYIIYRMCRALLLI